MKAVHTQEAPAPIGPYSQAVVTGNFVFCSGQIATDPATGELTGNNIQDQTRRILENLKAVLTAAGSSPAQVLKTTVFLTDMKLFPQFNEEYSGFFSDHHPARSTVQVSALPRNALIEIECIAQIS